MICARAFVVIGIGLVREFGRARRDSMMSSLLYGVSASDLSIYAIVTIV